MVNKLLDLSVVIVTLNEEKNISRAINSIKDIANEILIIDSGSTDKTIEIAEKLGAKVIFNHWEGYPSQVQFGIDNTNNKYVLVLDADEEVSVELKQSIINVFEQNLFSKYDCFAVNRKTFYVNKFLEHIWQPEYRIRLFNKEKVRYEGFLHEKVICNGKTSKLNGYLYHYTYKDIFQHYTKSLKYAKISAEELYKRGKKFRYHNLIINPLWAFFRQYFLKLGFLDGIRGLSVSMSYLFSTFLKYLFLWELEQKEKNKNARS